MTTLPTAPLPQGLEGVYSFGVHEILIRLWEWAARNLGAPKWALIFVPAACLLLYLGYSSLQTRLDTTDGQVLKVNETLSKTSEDLIKIRNSIQVLADRTPDKDLIDKMLSDARRQQELNLEQRVGPIERHVKELGQSLTESEGARADLQKQIKNLVDRADEKT